MIEIAAVNVLHSKACRACCLGGAIVLVPLWTLRAGLHEGLDVHFLGLTSLTLLLGWRLALLAPCLTLLILGAFGVTDLAEFGWQALIGIALPVATSWLLFLASWAWLPRHLFVYLFVAAFLGGLAVGATVAGLLTSRLSPRDSLRGYIALEIIVSVVALALPFELQALTPLAP